MDLTVFPFLFVVLLVLTTAVGSYASVAQAGPYDPEGSLIWPLRGDRARGGWNDGHWPLFKGASNRIWALLS